MCVLSAGNAYAGPSAMGGCTGTEADKQIGLWERRIKGLRRMLLGWDQARTPDPPNDIQLDVTSCTSVLLRIHESVEGSIATKCKGKQHWIPFRFFCCVSVVCRF